ncbi:MULTISPECIES: alpha/beta hydrolase [unclassified Prochlorococcus]|uniref:alpha/beta hydrolase n=1 Tax=unclassified Prochlorococcus TaxID=2627481 RepID=UPI000533B311|nr:MULTISPECIES: alpha/beta hydrolase [unclassified Prochlorococcus]KGG14498.1 hypothetical protein EV06_1555 [Prochlorococcus sp. MIT 0602]KGG16077.1 hypothetical protein EV07_2045 [Prochlorococcus sp. MIT 0603]
MKLKNYLIAGTFVLFSLVPTKVYSAEKINLYVNILSRSVSIKELEEFSKTGKETRILKKVLKDEDKETLKNLLKKEYKTPIKLTSRLLYSQIGEVILKKISKIMYPDKILDESTSIFALKSATILSISKENESINVLRFLKAYPSEVIAIDVIELSRVVNKVESMNELVKFFTDSPLEKLKSKSNATNL